MDLNTLKALGRQDALKKLGFIFSLPAGALAGGSAKPGESGIGSIMRGGGRGALAGLVTGGPVGMALGAVGGAGRRMLSRQSGGTPQMPQQPAPPQMPQ